MKKKLILTTSFHENRPVSVAGIGLWSKRTSAVEENALQQLLIREIAPKGAELIDAEVEAIQMMLQRRVRKPEERDLITDEWVRQHVGKENAERMIAYFRTGDAAYLTKPEGEGVTTYTLDLPVFEDLELEDRTFHMPALSYVELAELSQSLTVDQFADLMDGALQAGNVQAEEGESTAHVLERMVAAGLESSEKTFAAIKGNAARVAYALNRRIADGGPEIDAEWLVERLSPQQLNEIINFLRNGQLPEDDQAAAEAAPKNAVLPAVEF